MVAVGDPEPPTRADTPNAAPAGSDLDESFYTALVEGFADWQRDEASEDNPQLRDTCRQLLEREARLLDQRRFEDWLALLARQSFIFAASAFPSAAFACLSPVIEKQLHYRSHDNGKALSKNLP